MTSRPRTRLWALALCALAAAWLVTTGRGAAVYDGLPLATEPYRYLHPPAGYPTTPPPTAGQAVVAVVGGVTQSLRVMTTESGPQAQLVIKPGVFSAPQGGAALSVRIDPVDLPSADPPGSLDGNVYRFSASVGQSAVDFSGSGPAASVTLQGTGAPTSPVIEQYAAGSWTPLTTVVTSAGFYGANISHLGLLALAFKPGPGGGGGPSVIVGAGLAGCLGAITLAVAVVVARRRRRGGGSEDP